MITINLHGGAADGRAVEVDYVGTAPFGLRVEGDDFYMHSYLCSVDWIGEWSGHPTLEVSAS